MTTFFYVWKIRDGIENLVIIDCVRGLGCGATVSQEWNSEQNL